MTRNRSRWDEAEIGRRSRSGKQRTVLRQKKRRGRTLSFEPLAGARLHRCGLPPNRWRLFLAPVTSPRLPGFLAELRQRPATHVWDAVTDMPGAARTRALPRLNANASKATRSCPRVRHRHAPCSSRPETSSSPAALSRTGTSVARKNTRSRHGPHETSLDTSLVRLLE